MRWFKRKRGKDKYTNANNDELTLMVEYIGSKCIYEMPTDLFTELKWLTSDCTVAIRARFLIQNGVLKISELQQGTLLLSAPVHSVSFCNEVKDAEYKNLFAITIKYDKTNHFHVFRDCTSEGNVSPLSAIVAFFDNLSKTQPLKSNLKDNDFQGENSSPSSSTKPSGFQGNSSTDFEAQDELCMKFRWLVQAIESLDDSTLLRYIGEDVLNVRDNTRNTLLHCAVKSGNVDMVTMLLNRGANVDIRGLKHATPLQLAVEIGNRPIVKCLLAYGADVSARDHLRQTPLHICASGDQNMASLLIMHGAEINAATITGVRPTDMNPNLQKIQHELIQKAFDVFICNHAIDDDVKESSNLNDSLAHSRSPSLQSAINDFGSQSIEDCFNIQNHNDLQFDAERCCSDSANRVTQALDVLVTLSSRIECHQLILASITWSKVNERIFSLPLSAHQGVLQKISQLMHNLFNVQGVISMHKCLSVGLLKIVLEWLDAPEPLQDTCLSILNIVLQQNSNLSCVVSDIQIEALLTIVCSQHDDPFPKFASCEHLTTNRRHSNSDLHRRENRLTHHSSLSSLCGNIFTCSSFNRHEVVMKMLVAYSRVFKLHCTITKPHLLRFLEMCLKDIVCDSTLNAAIIIANICQNLEMHSRFAEMVDALCITREENTDLLVKYHVTRALVYMGHINLKGVNIVLSLDEPNKDPGNHQQIYGLSLERIVLELARVRCVGRDEIAEHEFVQLVITMHRTFVHPVIFMRLFLHCFEGMTQRTVTDDVSHLHQVLIGVLMFWLETFPRDFQASKMLQIAIVEFVRSMNRVGGQYLCYARKLEILLFTARKSPCKKSYFGESCHDVLYERYRKDFSEGHLFCSDTEFILLVSLQMYIHDLSKYGTKHCSQLSKSVLKARLKENFAHDKVAVKRTRRRISIAYKGLIKAGQSERDAKHSFINCCKTLTTCRYFNVRLSSEDGARCTIVMERGYLTVLHGDAQEQLKLSHLHQWNSDKDALVLWMIFRYPQDSLRSFAFLADSSSELKKMCAQFEMCVRSHQRDDCVTDDTRSYQRDDCVTDDMRSHQRDDCVTGDLRSYQRDDCVTGDTRSHQRDDCVADDTRTRSASVDRLILYDRLTNDMGDREMMNILEPRVFYCPMECECPFESNFTGLNLQQISVYELLDYPEQLAQQITLIDHALFCDVTAIDILAKISLGFMKTQSPSNVISLVAERFNQLSNWVVMAIVLERALDRRVRIFTNFVRTAEKCVELRNYNAAMAITVAALCTSHIRRLAVTRSLVAAEVLESLKMMEDMMTSADNHKRYRHAILHAPAPAVPYLGLYLKDLTFICDGNPDCLNGGTINISKLQKVHAIIAKITHHQKYHYAFGQVSQVKDFLLRTTLESEERLYQMSKEIEPSSVRSSPPPVVRSNSHVSITSLLYEKLPRFGSL